MIPSYAIVTSSRINAAEKELHYIPRNPNGIGAMYLHGANGKFDQAQEYPKRLYRLFQRLAMRGYRILAGDFGGLYTYGNDVVAERIHTARQILIDEGCDGRVVLVGASMGNSNAMRYAADHPENVRGMVGIMPLIDVPQVRDENVLGLRASVEAAWGIGPADPIPHRGRPHDRVAEMTSVPWAAWYGTADTVTTAAEIDQMVAALGPDSQATIMDTVLDHSDALIAKLPVDDVIAWIEALP